MLQTEQIVCSKEVPHMPIIDLRYRPSTRETIDGVMSNPVYAEYVKITDFPKRPVKTLEACVEELRSLDIVKAVVAGRDCETTYATPNTNDSVLECMHHDPELFIGFYGYDPGKGMTALRGFRKALEAGMRGASIDPCMAHRSVDDACYYPLYAACCDHDVPVIVTAGLSPYMPGVVLEHMEPRVIDRVARDFPELRLLISHGGYPWVNEAVAVCMRHRNVYMDFSSGESKLFGEFYIRAANEYITDKVLFSSANPFMEVAKAVRKYQQLDLTPEAREKMFYHNALKFLGVK